MSRTITYGLLLVVVLVTPACVSSERYASASNEIENQDEVIKRLRSDNENMRVKFTELENRYKLSQVELERLRGAGAVAQDVDSLRAELASMRDRLSQASAKSTGEADDAITVRQRPDGMALSVEGSVLFRLGSDEISAKGREILAEVARRIGETPHDIRVEGHTDNTPVVKTIRKYPLGNLQLSGARALNVANYLIKHGGIARDRVSYAGFGAERPVADNGTGRGREQNRRVEIVVLNR